MRITTDPRRPGVQTITAAGYRVELHSDPPSAVLSDPDGRVWSRLSLLASVDRVGAVDESAEVGAPTVHPLDPSADPTDPGRVAAVEIRSAATSTAWRRRETRLRCLPDRLELTVEVEGEGLLTDVRLLGGRALLASGACGMFRSSIDHASVFVPTPTEPVDLVRPAASPATLGVLGDAAPGRLHAVFSPPPLCLVLGRERAGSALDVPAGDWLALGLAAPVDQLRLVELRYQPMDSGFLLELDHDAHTRVAGTWRSPALVLRPAADPWQALADHRADLLRAGAPAGPAAPVADWWSEPIFCGWGAQCARAAHSALDGDPAGPESQTAGPPTAADLARQDVYDELLGHLAAHQVVPGTVVIDDKWQLAYGTGEPDQARWPDLRAWIAARHAAGQRVLLWWKAWDAEGLPPEECLVTPDGRPVSADPAGPAYRDRVRRVVHHLLGPDGLDADGFKVDFTQRGPAGHALRPGDGTDPCAGPWGVAAVHALLADLYRAAKDAKPDALVVTHTPHPAFADVCDMVRLNDVLERDTRGVLVPLADQMRVRRRIAGAMLPGHLIDTDQWPMTDLAQWREYVGAQAEGGVPALYYAERMDRSDEQLTADDLALVAQLWQEYRAGDRS
ncbi:hypothetical protein [Cellulomonas denverensis]|uniref:Glycoside hydrolase n=1 Tax=Cellulomonas denverensis TaxID=264297 RepID=A0A7X6KVR5_9CELL|nr:hypothetical protein [Cellulomonas denverensis]NKY23174.1 hypothetical protein [Cellulomonas denverensis]GIG26686.1 hypothetical protein Cde04nite_29300 [Cellulomonas denverensis]